MSDLDALAAALAELRAHVEAGRAPIETHPTFTDSAKNLGDYVVMRQHDLREVQADLAKLGLSSLGRAEADVARVLSRVGDALAALIAHPPAAVTEDPSRDWLDRHTDALFGPPPADRRVRIMVTASADLSAEDMSELVYAGMDVLRVNCAHDTPATWRRLAELARAAAAAQGRPCSILMDLGGPKLRTGALLPGPRVISWHPGRDERGVVRQPARIWIGEAPSPFPVDVSVPLARGARLTRLRPGDTLRVVDTRGRDRDIVLSAVTSQGVLGTNDRSAWIEAGAPLRRIRGRAPHQMLIGRVGDVPPLPGFVQVNQGDDLLLTRDPEPSPAEVRPVTVPCTLPEVFTACHAGDPILFDDGRMEGVVLSAEADRLHVRITRARSGGDHLRSDKGINLPDLVSTLPALTDFDLACLDEVVRLADMVGLSFVRRPDDVARLRDALAARGATNLGIVLKIETQLGFQNLPSILLEAMKGPRIGVMIARGDLAVECGFERLAELQEEILWVCEAAHVPAIWATQVLDNLARKGIPTRAEVTDASFGQRAECVMLNKGPHAVDAVRALADILRRMGTHHHKKTSMLRRLRSLGSPAQD